MAYWKCGVPTDRKVRFRIAGEIPPKLGFTITGYLVVNEICDEAAVEWTENFYETDDLIKNAEDIDYDVEGQSTHGPHELLRDAAGPVTVDLECSEDA